MVERSRGNGNGGDDDGESKGEVIPFTPSPRPKKRKLKQGELPHRAKDGGSGGRKREAANKYNRFMREAILNAAAKVGSDASRDDVEVFSSPRPSIQIGTRKQPELTATIGGRYRRPIWLRFEGDSRCTFHSCSLA
jgi:hypothetical protein